MVNIDEFINENSIKRLTIDSNNLTIEKIFKFETRYQTLMCLHSVHLFTGHFLVNANLLFYYYMSEEWHEKRPRGRFSKALKEVMAYVNTKDRLLKTTAVVIHSLVKLNNLLRKIDKVFEKYQFINLYLQMYKIFIELMVFDLGVLLYRAKGFKHFNEAEKFVERLMGKYFKVSEDPAELFFAFDDLADVLVQLTGEILDEEWERFEEEVYRHGGFIEDEKPND